MGRTVILISGIIILALVILEHTSSGQNVGTSSTGTNANSLTLHLLNTLLRITGADQKSHQGPSYNNNPIYTKPDPKSTHPWASSSPTTSYNRNLQNFRRQKQQQQQQPQQQQQYQQPQQQQQRLHHQQQPQQQRQQQYSQQSYQYQSPQSQYQDPLQGQFIQQQVQQRRMPFSLRRRRRRCTRQMVEKHCHCLPECPPLYEERKTCGGAAIATVDAMAQCCPFWMSTFNCW